MNESLPPPVAPAVDPAIDPRLHRLAQRSAAARAARGATPPPPPESVATPPVATAPVATRPVAPTARTNGRARKRHAAKGSRTAALALSATSTLVLAGYFHQVDASAASAKGLTTVPAAGTASTTAASASTTAASSALPAPSSSVTSATSGTTATTATTGATTVVSGLADGTYTGDGDTNRWGTVQVQITVAGGQITDVGIVQYPDGASKSVRINQRALPTLISEALTAQSSNVDTVSGATYTSDSYRISLQSAIDLAAAAAHG